VHRLFDVGPGNRLIGFEIPDHSIRFPFLYLEILRNDRVASPIPPTTFVEIFGMFESLNQLFAFCLG
jgi:hypothetical protein